MSTSTPDPHRIYWSGVFSGIGAGVVCTLFLWWADRYRLTVPRPLDFLLGLACFTAGGFLLGRHTRKP